MEILYVGILLNIPYYVTEAERVWRKRMKVIPFHRVIAIPLILEGFLSKFTDHTLISRYVEFYVKRYNLMKVCSAFRIVLYNRLLVGTEKT